MPIAFADLQANHAELWELRTQMSYLDTLDLKQRFAIPPQSFTSHREAMEISIAYRYGDTIRDQEEWNSPFGRVFPHDKRLRAEKIAADHPHVTAEEYAAAKAILDSTTDLQEHESFFKVAENFIQYFGLILVVGWLVWAAFFSVAAALITRRGLLLWAVGIDLVRGDGQPASRGRLLWRAIITWSPLVLLPVLLGFLVPALQVAGTAGAGAAVIMIGALGLMYLLLVVGSSALPVRGIPDRIAGTWPVPR
jgi:hypothetical protein